MTYQPSSIQQATEDVQLMAFCPACYGHLVPGLDDNPRNQMGPGPSNGRLRSGKYAGMLRSCMPVCRFCKGRGIVFLNRICVCGMPAVVYQKAEDLHTCGDPLCLTPAVWHKKGLPTQWHGL